MSLNYFYLLFLYEGTYIQTFESVYEVVRQQVFLQAPLKFVLTKIPAKKSSNIYVCTDLANTDILYL
jgi:hypothetical protein